MKYLLTTIDHQEGMFGVLVYGADHVAKIEALIRADDSSDTREVFVQEIHAGHTVAARARKQEFGRLMNIGYRPFGALKSSLKTSLKARV